MKGFAQGHEVHASPSSAQKARPWVTAPRACWRFALLLGVVLSLLPQVLFAEAADQAVAEQLFQDGQVLMQKGKAREACPKFAESQKLDPGTGTLLNLANCYEVAGQLASAWASYVEAENAAKRDHRQDRVEFAQARIQALLPRLSRVQFLWKGKASAPSGLRILLGNSSLSAAVLGISTPIDAGEHLVVVSAPGKKEYRTTLLVEGDGKVFVLEIPELLSLPRTAPPASPRAQREKPNSLQSWGGLLAGGLGLVSLGVGTGFGVHAISKFDESNRTCEGNECPPDGEQARWDARSAGDVATACVIAGSALLLGGAVLYLTVPSGSDETHSEAKSDSSRAAAAASGAAPSMSLRVSAGPGVALLGWDGQF